MIAGSLVLVLTVVALGAGAGFLAACVTVRSPVSFLLTTYLFAWTGIVGFTFALSPIHAVTRGTALVWSALVLLLALGIWLSRDRPVPRLRAALDAFGDALRDRAVLVAAAVPVIGVVYAIALAVGTPEDEGDALAYHVPRAAFWDQHHGVSYIAHAADVRLNVNPTFGEVGVLFTMLASGTQRFVGLVQIGAFAACGLSVAGLARRLGFGTHAAVFGAVVFAGLPVVVTQSWTAQNDLVVAAFLAAAGYFVLGDDRPDAVLGGLAIALAVGTKFTAIFLLPLLVLLIWLARRGRPRARVACLAALGAVIGAFWYVVNLWETHRLTGGLSEGETTPHTLASFAGTLQRFSYDMLDLSGVGNSDWHHAGPGMVVYRVVGLASLAFAAVWLVRRGRLGNAWWLLLPGVVVALVPTLISLAYDAVNTVASPHGFYLGGPLPNGLAASTVSWYGPVGVVGLLAGLGIALRGSPPGRRRLSVVLMAAAPIVGMACVAAAIVWDPTRGRFLIFPFALAAASWAGFLATRWLAWTVALLTVVTATLSFVNAEAKPTGIKALWPDSGSSVWGKPDWYAQTILRPDSDDTTMLRVAERLIPSDTTLTLASRPNDFLAPYFGRDLIRRVVLVRDGQDVSPASNWLVAAPGVRPRSCRSDWRIRYRLGVPEGWLIAERVGTANCPPSRF